MDGSRTLFKLPRAIQDLTMVTANRIIYSTKEGLFEIELGSDIPWKIADFGSEPFWDVKTGKLLFTRLVDDKEALREDIYIAWPLRN